MKYMLMLIAGWTVGLTGFAGEKAAKTEEDTKETQKFVVIGDLTYTEEQVEADYQRMKRKYGLSHHKRELGPIKNLGGQLINGKILEISGTRMILETAEHGLTAVMKKGKYSIDDGNVTLAVKGMGKYSYRGPASGGGRQSIQQFRDITLTRDEFIRAVRNGYSFKGMKTVKTDRSFSKAGPNQMLQTGSGFKRKRTKIKGSY